MADEKFSAQETAKLLHQNCRNNIQFAKEQQWKIFYYSILAYAALVGAASLMDKLFIGLFALIVCLGVLFVAGGCGYVLKNLQSSPPRNETLSLRSKNSISLTSLVS